MDSKKGEVVLYGALVLILLVLGYAAFLSIKPVLTGAAVSIQHHATGHFPQAVAVQMINSSSGDSTSGGGFIITTSLARNINGSLVSNQNISLTGLGASFNINLSLIRNTTHGNIVNASFAWQLARSNGSIMLNRTTVNTTANQSSFVLTVGFGQLPDGIYNVSVFIENLTVDGPTTGEINLSAALEIGVDATPPNVTQLFFNTTAALNASNFTNSGVLEFNITANDSTLTVQEVKLGYTNDFRNGTEVNITAPRNGSNYAVQLALSTLSDGLYSLVIYANDTAGNFNGSVANLSFRVDRTPPNISVFLMNISNATIANIPQANTIQTDQNNGSSVQINVTVNDSTTSITNVKFQFTQLVNGSLWNETATKSGSFWTVDFVSNRSCAATVSIQVYANDTLGNINDSVANLSIRVQWTNVAAPNPQCADQPGSSGSTSSSDSGSGVSYGRASSAGQETAPQQQQQQPQQQQQQYQQPQPTAEEVVQQRQQEQRTYFQQNVVVQTGPVTEKAAEETAEGGAAAEETTTEALGETETESIAITNSGSETLALQTEVEVSSPPPLPHAQEARQKLQEELRKAFPDKAVQEIEELVEKQLESLELLEQEDVQYLVSEQYHLSRFWQGKAGLTGGAVAVTSSSGKAKSPPAERPLPPTRPSLSGITPTKKRITGNLLKTELQDMGDIVVPPGATIEKEIQVRRGLSLSPKPITIHFVSEGQRLLQKELSGGEVVTGGAVDVDQAANTFDLYFVLPPKEAAGIYQLELLIEKEVPAQRSPGRKVLDFLTRRKKQTLYSELFGPFKIPVKQGYILAQQFAYEEGQYYGRATIVTKIYRDGKVMAEQNYPVILG